MPLLRARVPAALAVLLALALAAPLTAYADEPTPAAEPTATAEPVPTTEPASGAGGVTFPEDTTVQPRVDDYVVEVEAPEYDSVQVATRGWSTSVPPTATVEVEFPWDGPDRVVVSGCRAEVCTEIARGPELVVRRWLGASVEDRNPTVLHAGRQVILDFPSWAAEDLDGDLEWELVIDGAPVASGATSYRPHEEYAGAAMFSLDGVPDGVGGAGQLVVRLSDDVAGFGVLTQTTSVSVVWDDRVQARFKVGAEEFYPVRDRYLDWLSLSLYLNEGLSAGRVEVVDGAGDVVRTLESGLTGSRGSWSGTWNGRDDAGLLVPEGTYSVQAVLTDLHRNEDTFARAVVVHHEELVREVWKQTFRASDTVVDTAVGRCSDYRTPSSRRDRGSFQLASQTRCRTASQSHAVAPSGIYLPPSMKNHYRKIAVTMRGGPSTGARGAYVVLAFLQENGKLQGRRVLRGSYGKHTISVAKNGQVVRKEKSGRRYLFWQAGLSEGSRWDVESYTVRAVIKVLR